MSPVAAGLIAAVLLPVSRAVIPNPIWARWYWTNGRTPMPPALTRRSQRVELVLPFASLAVVALGLGILLDASDVTIETLIHLHPGRAIVWGTAAGLGWWLRMRSCGGLRSQAPDGSRSDGREASVGDT